MAEAMKTVSNRLAKTIASLIFICRFIRPSGPGRSPRPRQLLRVGSCRTNCVIRLKVRQYQPRVYVFTRTWLKSRRPRQSAESVGSFSLLRQSPTIGSPPLQRACRHDLVAAQNTVGPVRL